MCNMDNDTPNKFNSKIVFITVAILICVCIVVLLIVFRGSSEEQEVVEKPSEQESAEEQPATSFELPPGDVDEGTTRFVIANGWSEADVGVASALAAISTDGVVVYTAGDELPEETRVLLNEGFPAEVILIGGNEAISQAVAEQIAAAAGDGVDISRLTGSDRIETASAAARQILGDPEAGPVTLVVANGRNAADIGVAASLASRVYRTAVIYTEQDDLPKASEELIREYQVKRVVLIGGNEAISQAAAEQITAAAGDGADVARIGGDDRIATAAAGAYYPIDDSPETEHITLVVANGWNAADIGVAAFLAATIDNAAVAYTMADTLPEETAAVIREHRVTRVILIGGQAAISDAVHIAIVDAAPENASVQRLTGDNRTATAVRVAWRVLTGQWNE